jgi:hypothetical protein
MQIACVAPRYPVPMTLSRTDSAEFEFIRLSPG